MEKKLKNGADKIKMPADMKQRIISAAELAEKNRVNTDSDDYIEVVRSSERITTKTRIIKAVSAIAACAVLVGGIGTTGFLLYRQHNEHMTSGEVSGSACRSCPFGDFSEFKYNFDANDKAYSKYSPETYEKLSDFLNCFNWGESVEAPEDKKNKVSYSGWQDYVISWEIGDTPPVIYNIDIANDGYVYYREIMSDFESGKYKIIEKKWYKIDFEAFNSGVKEILALDPVSQFGDFNQFSYKFDAGDGKDGSYSDETYAQLSDFLNSFNWGDALDDSEIKKDSRYLKFEKFEEEYDYIKKLKVLDNEDRVYIITRSTPQGHSKIVIVNGGYVSYTDFSNDLFTDIGPVVTDSECYKIDFEAFDRGITDILTGKSDTAVSDTLTGEDDSITTELGEKCETEGWEYLIKTVDVTKSGEGMTPFPEGHYSCNENGDLTCDSSYIIADMELTNKSSDDRSLYMNSTLIDLYNYNAEELDFKTSMEATAYTFNGERPIYAGDFFKTDFKAGETKTFRVGYVIDDEYLDKNYDIIRIEINHSGVADPDKNIRYYNLGEDTNLNVIAQKQAKPNTEVFERAKLYYATADGLTPISDEGVIGLDDFLLNDFKEMLQPTKSDDIVGGLVYGVDLVFKLDDNKMRTVDYFIYMDGFVECNECETDENGEMQLTNTENYQIDMAKLESVLKDEIGVELPEHREININKVD